MFFANGASPTVQRPFTRLRRISTKHRESCWLKKFRAPSYLRAQQMVPPRQRVRQGRKKAKTKGLQISYLSYQLYCIIDHIYIYIIYHIYIQSHIFTCIYIYIYTHYIYMSYSISQHIIGLGNDHIIPLLSMVYSLSTDKHLDARRDQEKQEMHNVFFVGFLIPRAPETHIVFLFIVIVGKG